MLTTMAALTSHGRIGIPDPYSFRRLPRGLTRSSHFSIQSLSAPNHIGMFPLSLTVSRFAWSFRTGVRDSGHPPPHIPATCGFNQMPAVASASRDGLDLSRKYLPRPPHDVTSNSLSGSSARRERQKGLFLRRSLILAAIHLILNRLGRLTPPTWKSATASHTLIPDTS